MSHRNSLAAVLTAVLVHSVAACGDGASPVDPAAAGAPSLARGGGLEPWPPYPPVDEFATDLCGFTVLLKVEGPYKLLTFPNGRAIWIVPANKVTWTNTVTGKTVTVTTTGTLHETRLPNGDTELVFTGHTPFYDPVGGSYDYLSGRFSTIMGPDGSTVQPLEGSGKRTPVCEIVA